MRLRHIIYYIGIWMMFLFILFLTSCRTRTVAMDRYVAYDRTSSHTDTTLQSRFIQAFEQMARYQSSLREKSVRETSQVKDSVSTTVDADGKPIKTERWHTEVNNRESKETTRLKDSVLVLRQTVDSLQELRASKDSLLVASKDSINELRKNVTTFLERCDTLEKLLGVPIVLYVVSLIVFFVWKKCKNSL